MGSQYGSVKGERGKGKGERGKGKGERGKVSNTSFIPYPLTFSQTTREVHTAYANRIASSLYFTHNFLKLLF